MAELDIVAIDGPAGSGKSSLCQKACESMNWSYLSTGASFRSIAYVAQSLGLDVKQKLSAQQKSQVFAECEEHLSWNFEKSEMQYRGESLSKYLYGESVGKLASIVAEDLDIREFLKQKQRYWTSQSPTSCVLVEGRDIGSVIFPETPIKIFITASAKVRAERRYAELREKGDNVDLAELEQTIKKRDHFDANREHAPMKKVDDAFELDTSDLPFDVCLKKLCDYISAKIAG